MKTGKTSAGLCWPCWKMSIARQKASRGRHWRGDLVRVVNLGRWAYLCRYISEEEMWQVMRTAAGAAHKHFFFMEGIRAELRIRTGSMARESGRQRDSLRNCFRPAGKRRITLEAARMGMTSAEEKGKWEEESSYMIPGIIVHDSGESSCMIPGTIVHDSLPAPDTEIHQTPIIIQSDKNMNNEFWLVAAATGLVACAWLYKKGKKTYYFIRKISRSFKTVRWDPKSTLNDGQCRKLAVGAMYALATGSLSELHDYRHTRPVAPGYWANGGE